MEIREATAADRQAIRNVHLDAFDDEGASVAALAVSLMADDTARPLLALVAEADGEVVGNVIFSTVYIEGAGEGSACILAPLAVVRHYQRGGIGRALVGRGLETLRARGTRFVFVLGDPRYYGRFGFSSRHRVRAPYAPACPEAWMALALQGDALAPLDGTLRCARSLDQPALW
ncbi:MAG: N-acetyltransferase [Pseudomonadota bacterium]